MRLVISNVESSRAAAFIPLSRLRTNVQEYRQPAAVLPETLVGDGGK